MSGLDSHTKLLLHFEDFIDASSLGITAVPSVGAVLNNNGKFGKCAAFPNSVENYGVVTIPYQSELSIGISKFTLDFWVKDLYAHAAYCGFNFLDSVIAEGGIKFEYEVFNNNVYSGFHLWIATGIPYQYAYAFWPDGITRGFLDDPPYCEIVDWDIFNPSNWNHFALTVEDLNAELYINGHSQGIATLEYSYYAYGTEDYIICGENPMYEWPVSTLIDEYRLSIGVIRWSEDFTPPTEPYSSDPKLVKLILHMNGVDESQVFVDSSAAPHTVVAEGNVKQDTGWYQLGTASGQFDSSSDYLSIADTTNWEIFNNPFTIHFWFRPINITGSQKIFRQGHSSNTFMQCTYNHAFKEITFELMIWGFRKLFIQVVADLPLNEFSHIAIVGN